MIINSIDKDGIKRVYNVILTMHNDDYNKDYIVYTDNKYDQENNLQIYFNEYKKENVISPIKSINDKKEFKTIKTEINKVLLTLKNETFKLDMIDLY